MEKTIKTQICSKCDREKPIGMKGCMDNWVCNDCRDKSDDDINESIDLGDIGGSVILEGYNRDIVRLERLLNRPNEGIVASFGGIGEYRGKIGRKIDNIRKKLLEVRPPNFPIRLARKIRRKYINNPSKAYSVMWELHSKHGRGIKEMWLAFEGKLNEGINNGLKVGLPLIKRGLGESPDAIYGKDDVSGNKKMVHHYRDEDARPFIMFNGICALRNYHSIHPDMLNILRLTGRSIVDDTVDGKNLVYGLKMSLYNENMDKCTFYFSSIPKREWFIDLYRAIPEESHTWGRHTDSGRIWLSDNLVSFWKGSTLANVKLLLKTLKNMRHSPKGIKIEKYDASKKEYTGEFTGTDQLKESPDGFYFHGKSGGWTDDDSRPFLIFEDVAIVRGFADSHSAMVEKLCDFSWMIKDNEIRDSEIVYGKKMNVTDRFGGKKTYLFSDVVNREFFVKFFDYYKSVGENVNSVLTDIESGRIWLNERVITFWKGNSYHNIGLVADALNLDAGDIRPEKPIDDKSGDLFKAG